MSPQEFQAVLSRVRWYEDKPGQIGYCKVKATLRHENGKESSKGKYRKGKQTGSWTWWHDSGQRKEEGDYLQGRKAGQWITYYESGHKQEEGLFHNGMKNGTWTYYNDNDDNTIFRRENWQLGQLKEEKIVDDPSKAKSKKGRGR